MRTNDHILLENAYKKVLLINEISASYVDQVKDAVADKELPFNNIFGNKLRLKIPIEGTETYREIIQQVSKIKNFYQFDPQKKEVIKKIKIDPKFGGGEKFQRINLGRAISLLSLPEEKKKKMLDWFANYSSNIPEMDDMKKYTIVISRSPIDVLRMSDIGKIQSCHSQGGQYFHCAIAEAKNGGPIAYIVKTDDLKNLSEEEFQYDEIFEDSERDIKGINAISRIRIRRYVDDETKESLAIPETRIYGSRISGFYKTVKDFLKEKQFSDEELEEISSKFKKRDLTRTGGSYSDSSDSHLFNQMFDTNTFYGSLPHDSSEEDVGRYEQFREELFHMKDNVYLKGFYTWYDVEEGDEGYVYYNAGAALKLDLDELNIDPTKEFFECLKEIDSYYGLTMIRRYDPNSQYAWQKILPHGFVEKENLLKKFQKFLTDFEKFDPTNFVAGGMSFIYTPYYSNKEPEYITLECCFGDDCNGSDDDTDKYRDFLNDIKDYDENYKAIIAAFVKALRINGFDGSMSIDDIIDDSNLEKEFQTFDVEEPGDVGLFNKLIGVMNTPKDNPNYRKDINQRLQAEYPIFLENYLNAHYKPQPSESPRQMKFKGFLESMQNKKKLSDYGITAWAKFFIDDFWQGKKPDEINFTLSLRYDGVLSKSTYDVLLFLDKNSDDLLNAARYFMFSEILGTKSQYVDNLRRLYSKYFVS